MRVLVNTGSTMGQGRICKGGGKMEKEYLKETALCFINPDDFQLLKEPARVKVETRYGPVVLKTRIDDRMRRGHVFIPRGFWANQLTLGDTGDCGNPLYKGIEAELKPTSEDVKNIGEILDSYRK
ncbi:MAG: molybdopterin dinucleotide binding domain-containing protein [Candidatus Altiarchaeota archaeon]|nr:molybdopterin dinucleotide binding domain-containing protein [Candidatus Altiarchaeota archaeon]